MFKNKLLIFIFVILLSIYFLFNKIIIADTGYSFAYDYLNNKFEFNNTNNKIKLKNNNDSLIEFSDTEFEFTNIYGFKPNDISNFDDYYPSTKQLYESVSWIRSNGGDHSNKFSNLKVINKDNISKLKLDFKVELNNKFFKKKMDE